MKSRESARRSILHGSYDVCIIGGGATGLGCALDARLRGFSTVLLDAGGLCLAHLHGLHQAGARRRPLPAAGRPGVRSQPVRAGGPGSARAHVHAAPRAVSRPSVGAAGSVLQPAGDWPTTPSAPSSTTGLPAPPASFPAACWAARRPSNGCLACVMKAQCARDRLVGSVSYADGQFDDARFGIALAQTFAQQGGELINYAKGVAFARDSNGKLDGPGGRGPAHRRALPGPRQGLRKLHRSLRRPAPPRGQSQPAGAPAPEQRRSSAAAAGGARRATPRC